MTKSIITRERIQRIIRAIDSEAYDEEEIREWLSSDEIMELSRMALAAMDSEPVILYRQVNPANGMKTYWAELDPEEFRHLKQHTDENAEFMTLYRHAQQPVESGEYGDPYQGAREDLAIWKRRALEAEESVRRLEQINDHLVKEAQGESRMGEPVIAQPAPVVPEEATPDSIEILASARRRDHSVFQWDEDQRNAAADSWNAFRAAMLQELKKSAGTEAICRSDENVQVLHTKSPAQSDCCPAQNQGWIPVSERMPEDRISVILWDAEIGEVTSGHYSHKTQTFYHCGDAIENEITHWMPPPCAPQEVK